MVAGGLNGTTTNSTTPVTLQQLLDDFLAIYYGANGGFPYGFLLMVLCLNIFIVSFFTCNKKMLGSIVSLILNSFVLPREEGELYIYIYTIHMYTYIHTYILSTNIHTICIHALHIYIQYVYICIYIYYLEKRVSFDIFFIYVNSNGYAHI